MADTETEWTKEFPTADGYYFYRWNGQRCVFTIALGKIWSGMSEQHPPLTNAEWLGPFDVSDFEQLTRLREAAGSALEHLDLASAMLSYPHNKKAQNTARALRAALAQPRPGAQP